MTQRNTLSRLGGLQMVGVPANINRRTGEPHKHQRNKDRNLKNNKVNG